MTYDEDRWRADPARALVEKARLQEMPVPELAEARVWRALRRSEERQRRRPAWAMFAAGLGCAAMVALVLVTLRTSHPHGNASVFYADGVQRPVHLGEVVSSRGEHPVVELPGSAQLVLGREASVRVDRFDASGVSIIVDHGSLLAHVVPRRGREPFLVRTPEFVARVVGTVFRVVVGANGASSISVAHGRVDVEARGGEHHIVAGGDAWPAGKGERPERAELDRLGVGELEGVTLDAFLGAASPPSPPAPVECPSEPNLGIACKLALASATSGVRAENALYEAGSIAFRELHDPTRALEIWEGLQIRFPGGLLAEEAQASIIDALVALHRTAAAEREIERYLHAHPRGLRAAEMHYVLGSLLRAQDGDCRRAAREFERALEQPAEPWATRARGACVPARPE